MLLDVGNGHQVYFEEYGNPKGIKILFLHGGPGLGCSEKDKDIFDPERFHVIFIDQRGSGRSTPKGETNHNTTEDLIDDINRILDHLQIDKVTVLGGSWGATLAVLYAAHSPQKVNKLILRGFFSATKECVDIFLGGEIKSSHPKEWERFYSMIPEYAKNKVPEYVFDSVIADPEGSSQLAYEWARYGFSLSRKEFQEEELDQLLNINEIDKERIKVKLHYILNAFFISNGEVYNQASRIKHIPPTIIHGTHDYLCPIEDAKKLAAIFTNAKLVEVDGGHSSTEKEIKNALIEELNQVS